MPGREERYALALCDFNECLHLADGGAWRLLEQYVQAAFEREPGHVVANLRRRAERDGIDVALRSQQAFEIVVALHAFEPAMRAGNGGELEFAARGYDGNMLVACNLAEAGNRNLQHQRALAALGRFD